MKYLLDTDTCIYWMNGNKAIEKKVMEVGVDHIAISFITLSELYYGANKSQRVHQNLVALKKIETKLKRIDSDEGLCRIFGELKTELEKSGNIIADADLFIAGCALTNNLILVTNNTRHFSRIKGLMTENWVGSV